MPKNAEANIQRSIRLPRRTWEMIDELGRMYGASQSQIVVLAVDRMHLAERRSTQRPTPKEQE